MNLIYQTSPAVTFATNVFVDVPVILQFDEEPLISVVKEEGLGYTSEIPIYHADGTYLAKVNGTRVFATEDGKKAGIVLRDLPGLTVCEVGGKTAFEVHHQPGDAFRLQAELSTPNGYFVRFADVPVPQLTQPDGQGVQVGGVSISRAHFQGCRIGIWVKSTGGMEVGVR